MITFLVILTLVIGFYMLCNMGANDVANAIGTSVGSKALTLKKAIIIAAILEFLGAFLLGANVSSTIQKGIVNPEIFAGDPMIFVYGMLASLLGTALWVQIATIFKWPVSTTHAIIGAVVGFALVVGGTKVVAWSVIGSICLSWVVSPVLSGLIAYLFFLFIQRKILFSLRPLEATKKVIPCLVFIVILSFIMTLGFNGIKNIGLNLSFHVILGFSFLIALIACVISWYFCHHYISKDNVPYALSMRKEQQFLSLKKVQKQLMKAKFVSSGNTYDEIKRLEKSVETLREDLSSKQKQSKKKKNDEYLIVEKSFAYLQLLSACFVAFAHGANDVANAVGPVSAILEVLKNPDNLHLQTKIPLWLLAFGGAGIVIGLATFGWRVVETIGKKITQLTPTRGFSAEFGAAFTIILASKMSLPISTTHCIVGAVLGVGLAHGFSALNLRTIRDIFMSWIITIPSAAIVTILFYFLFTKIF